MPPSGRPCAVRARRVATAVTLVAMLTAVGCGDSDDTHSDGGRAAVTDSPGDATAQTTSGERADGPALTGDRRQAAEGAATVDRIYEDLEVAADAGVASIDVPVQDTLSAAEDDPGIARLCDLMSERAKRQTIVFADRSAGLADVDWTCEKATGLLLRRTRHTGGLGRTLRARIVSVDARGDRATAIVSFGGARRSKVELVKEDGEWKLAASPGG